MAATYLTAHGEVGQLWALNRDMAHATFSTPAVLLNSSSSHVRDCAGPKGRQADLVRISLGVGDQFGNGIDRERGIHFQDKAVISLMPATIAMSRSEVVKLRLV